MFKFNEDVVKLNEGSYSTLSFELVEILNMVLGFDQYDHI